MYVSLHLLIYFLFVDIVRVVCKATLSMNECWRHTLYTRKEEIFPSPFRSRRSRYCCDENTFAPSFPLPLPILRMTAKANYSCVSFYREYLVCQTRYNPTYVAWNWNTLSINHSRLVWDFGGISDVTGLDFFTRFSPRSRGSFEQCSSLLGFIFQFRHKQFVSRKNQSAILCRVSVI